MNLKPTTSCRRALWLWLLACALTWGCGSLFAQDASRVFEHAKTGFQLSGIHANTRCESCHVQGVFKGTPRDCASCHTSGMRLAGANVVKPVQHLPTQAGCDTCHSAVSFSGAKFSHNGIAPNSCATCHNGNIATGKPAGHIQTQAACSTCHRTTAWLPAGKPDHSLFTAATNCSSCHNGSSATGKASTHIPTTANCISCHSTTAWLPAAKPDHSLFTAATNCSSCHNGSSATGKTSTHIPTSSNCVSCHSTVGWKPAKWNHSQMPVANQCATCHSGAFPPADGPTSNHIPYKSLSGVAIANCDTCHKAGYAAWNPGAFHSNVPISSQCASCHLSSNYGLTSKPATAIHASVTGNCESCHKTTSTWSASKPNHSLFTAATNCSSCHNGSSATGKTAMHIPTTVNCVNCHNTTGWKPARWNHSQMPVANQCSTCHSGAYPPADGRPANHIPYQMLSGVAITNCDTCHKAGYAAWYPGTFHSNVPISSQCASCHLSSNYGLTSKPATAIHASVTGNCEGCHKTTSTWAASKPDHSLFTVATNCSSCHNGSAAAGKTATHIPTTVNCISCHSTTGWKPARWNHSQMPVANQCSTCHSGAYPPADGRPVNHIPYQMIRGVAITNCDSCHKAGYAAWYPGAFHSNVAVSTQCATCHLTGNYGLTSKPATAIHASVTGNCEGCHRSTSTWAASKPDHSLFTVATNCSSCHNGSAAAGKTAMHIPTTVNCINCHSTVAWRPTKWNHSQMPVANQCSTCHSGAYPPADGRPANHIPYQMLSGVAITNCDTCHKAGYAAWYPGKFHSSVSVSTQCATCHLTGNYGLPSRPATVIHASITGNCESCHRSTSSWLNVQYTHSPANAVGTGTCDTCHNGSTGAVSKPTSHIPVPAGSAKCDSCHRSQVSFASSVSMNHSVVTTATCKSCHNGMYTSAGAQGALAKPANHVPETQLLNGAAMDCKACHSSTVSWATERMDHNASMGNGAGWCKACHQTGTSYLGSMTRMSLTHRGGSSIKTDCSQAGCHRPLGSTGATYRNWN